MAGPDIARPNRRSFLSLLAAAPVLAACNGGGGALGENRSGGEVTELVVPINSSPWLPAFKEVAAQYQREAGIRITLREFPYDGLKTAMTNAIQGGSHPFDLYLLDEPWTGQFYANGWVRPLTDIDPGFAMDSQVADYANLPRWDAESRTASPQGKIMGLPVNGNVNVFMYRKDLYDELGLSVPKTFDEVLANAARGRDSGRVRYGYVVRAQTTSTGQSISYEFMPLLYSYGGDWYGQDWTPAINSEGAVAAMETFKRLTEFGPPQPQTVGQAEVIAAMQGGEALQCHVVAAAAAQLENPDKSNVAGKIGYAVMPAGGTGKPTPTSGVWTMAVPAGLPDERAKAAREFIGWVLGQQPQLTFAKAGGIPTRRDTYQAQDLPERARPYLAAIADSLSSIRNSVRYPFAAEMLPQAEQVLGAIAAGNTPVRAGLDDLAGRLRQIARDAGYGR